MSPEATTDFQESLELTEYRELSDQKEAARQRARAAFVSSIVKRFYQMHSEYLKEKDATGFEPFEEESSMYQIDEVFLGWITDMEFSGSDLTLGTSVAFLELYDDPRELEEDLRKALGLSSHTLGYDLMARVSISDKSDLIIRFA